MRPVPPMTTIFICWFLLGLAAGTPAIELVVKRLHRGPLGRLSQGPESAAKPFPPHAFFERLSLNRLHDIEALAILFSVINNSRDIGVMESRRRTCFAQESRPSGRGSYPLRVDDLEGDLAVEDCISCACGDCHCSGTEFYRMTVRTKYNFKASIARRSLHRGLAFWGE